MTTYEDEGRPMTGLEALDKAINAAGPSEYKRALVAAKFDLSLAAQGERHRIRLWAMERALQVLAAQPELLEGKVLADFADDLVEYVVEGAGERLEAAPLE